MLTALAPVDGDAVLPLADARVHLNLTADEAYHDAAIFSLRNEAISLVEEHSRRSLQARQFLWEIDAFSRDMRPPILPSQSVDAISYRDRDGLDVALTVADWRFAGGFINVAYGLSWPSIGRGRGGVRITFTAGYVLATDIPPLLIVAVKLAMTAMFEDRSNPDLSAALRIANRLRRRTL